MDTTIAASERGTVALLAGVILMGAGGYFFPVRRSHSIRDVQLHAPATPDYPASPFGHLKQSIGDRRIGAGVLAAAMLVTGALGIIGGARLLTGGDALTVREAWARPAGAGETDAVYLTIANHTGNAVRVVEAATDAAALVQLHQTVIEDAVARMETLDSLEIPSGETLRMEPPGTHFMLVDLQDDLAEGGTFPLTLTFDTGANIAVNVQVHLIAPDN
jgi:hypothetical protein